MAPSCNPVSIGIELENLNTGRDPYPPAQYSATLELVRYLVSKYNIPRSQLVRHLDIAPKRKTDPAGFPWERFVAEVYAAGPAPTPPPAQPAVAAPAPQPIQPSQQLRKLLVDLAYRAAGGGRPFGWPLLKEAVSKNTGMPIAVHRAGAQRRRPGRGRPAARGGSGRPAADPRGIWPRPS